MPVDGVIPGQLLTLAAAATVFTVMLTLGLGIAIVEFRWVLAHPGLVVRGLFAVLIAVPAIALIVTRALDLPRMADIGIVLMAISPGAPVALRRSLDAGGHRAFAPALQIMVALLAVVSMPLSIAALDVVYAGDAEHLSGAPRKAGVHRAAPSALARHVDAPLRRGARGAHRARAGARRKVAADHARGHGARQRMAGSAWTPARGSAVAVVLVTACALAVGHLLGGPVPATRTAVAITSAARNPGLALLVASLNAPLLKSGHGAHVPARVRADG